MIYSSWDIEQNKLKFMSFFALYPPKNPKNQNFEKWKNLLKISSFYKWAPKITIIWCTVPEIQSETDKKFCQFEPFFALLPPTLMILNIKILKKMKKCLEILSFYTYMCTTNEDHIWFLKYKVRQTEVVNILGCFLPFQSLDKLENQNFNIEKNTWRYYHLTHLYHKWQSYDIGFLRYRVQQT